MRVLIVEDETAAAYNLRSILGEVDPLIEVVAITESVTETVEFIKGGEASIDIIFMDIHLADGDAFRIFSMVDITTPIIFTTAYDQYALQAFKVNSVDYLLKPISSEEVSRALIKLKQLSQTVHSASQPARLRQVSEQRREITRTFLVNYKDKIIPLQPSDIALFYTSDERVWAYCTNGDIYPLDGTMESINALLDPAQFTRANRQFIVARHAIKDISRWFGSRLSLNLVIDPPEIIIIPKARVNEFREWLQLTLHP